MMPDIEYFDKTRGNIKVIAIMNVSNKGNGLKGDT
jgi:hypothetical protein